MLVSGRLVDFDRHIAPLVAAGLISAAGSAVGAGINATSQSVSNKKSWRYTQKAMKLQQQYALEQMQKQYELNMQANKEYFDYQNAYNEPSKVFERYMAAGINPAAVLGASGVGVNATMSGSPSSTAGTPSGPSADFDWKPADASMLGSGAASAGQLMLESRRTDSEVQRNQAAAARDSAEADDIRAKQQTPEYYRSIAELNRDIQKSGVQNARAVADMNEALARIYQADAAYADTSATYKFQDLIAQYSKHVEEYNGLRKYNVEYMDRVLDAQIALDAARAYESMASGGELKANTALAGIRLADAQNWFDVNWNVEVDVPRYDEKGKVIKTERYTGKQIAMELRSLDLSSADLSKAESRWSVRNEKNRLGYDMLRYFSGAVGAAAGSAMTRAAGGPVRMSETSTEHYDRNGEYIGGTYVRRSDVRHRSRK